MRLAPLAAAAALAAACMDPPPQLPEADPPAAAPGATAEMEQPPARAAVAEDDAASWQRLAQQLEVDNQRLEQERDHWKGEAERFHQGLERAVGELNRLSGESNAARAAAQAAQAAGVRPVRVQTIGAPQVQILGDRIMVTGRLWNSGDREAQGRLTVELLADSHVTISAEQALLVPANGEVAFAENFPVRAVNGVIYTARVTPRY